jgi:hypothetical protein
VALLLYASSKDVVEQGGIIKCASVFSDESAFPSCDSQRVALFISLALHFTALKVFL